MGGRKAHKHNPKKIPGQSCERFVYVFSSSAVVFVPVDGPQMGHFPC